MKSIINDDVREEDFLNDNQDKFNSRHLAKHLLQYIQQKKWPISIGIYGKWGSGKSTLVNFLQKNAEKESIKITIYDAVEYRGISENLLIRKISENNYSGLLVFVMPWIFAGMVVFMFFIPFINTLLTKITVAVVFTGLLYFLRLVPKFIMWFPKMVNFISIHFFKSKHFSSNIVIIENIDRLLPSQSISFLEQLKSVLLKNKSWFSSKTAYIIPCDFNVLQEEVREIYKNKEIDAVDYLNKLIEIPFYLPSTRIYLPDFIKSLLSDEIGESQKEKVVSIFNPISAFSDTPRDIKNYLLELDMIFVVAKSRGKQDYFLKENIASILVIQMIRVRFNSFYEYLKVYNDELVRDGMPIFGMAYSFYNHSQGTSITRDAFGKIYPSFSRRYSDAHKLLCLAGMLFYEETNTNTYKLRPIFQEIVDILDSASQAYVMNISDNAIAIDTVSVVMK